MLNEPDVLGASICLFAVVQLQEALRENKLLKILKNLLFCLMCGCCIRDTEFPLTECSAGALYFQNRGI